MSDVRNRQESRQNADVKTEGRTQGHTQGHDADQQQHQQVHEYEERLRQAQEALNRAEANLRWSEEHLRMVVNGARDYAIFMVDPQGIVVTWNDGAQRMKQWRADEIIGRHFGVLYRPEDRNTDRPNHNLEKAREMGIFEETYPRMKKDGTVFIADVTIHTIKDEVTGRLRGFSKVVRDVTERQLLLQRVVSAQENERRRISRELHDETSQHLTGLALGLKALETLVQTHCPPDAGGAALLERLRHTAVDLGRDVHRVAVELRPTSLDDLGLVAALGAYIEQWSQRTGLPVEFDSIGLDDGRLPEMVETTGYRVVQEALTNIYRHALPREPAPDAASALRISVMLQRRDGQFQATIEDDGPGFDVGDAARSGRLGLSGMRERAASCGGTIEIESTPGDGTVVYLRIPPEE